MYLIISCLPFAVKSRMFWNMIGKSDNTGVAYDTIYSGLKNLYHAPPNEVSGQAKVDDKVRITSVKQNYQAVDSQFQILQALAISLQFDISSEIYRFSATRPRFPDPLNVSEKISQLPLFTQFFAAAPKTTQVDDIGNSRLLVSTLGAIHAISNPISF
jgi:hypothetical protein